MKIRHKTKVCIPIDKLRLGSFKTAKEAHKAYCDASKKLHGIFGRNI